MLNWWEKQGVSRKLREISLASAEVYTFTIVATETNPNGGKKPNADLHATTCLWAAEAVVELLSLCEELGEVLDVEALKEPQTDAEGPQKPFQGPPQGGKPF